MYIHNTPPVSGQQVSTYTGYKRHTDSSEFRPTLNQSVCGLSHPNTPQNKSLVSHDDVRRTSHYLLSKFRITTNCMFSTSWHPPTVIPAESSTETEVKEANSFIL